jgi:outer membrane protein assembly factor BamA
MIFPAKALAQDRLEVTTAPDSATLSTVPHYFIKDIIINGNDKTKPATILRELRFERGILYPAESLEKRVRDARDQLMNTGLFTLVGVRLQQLEAGEVNILIDVQERWYIFPIPFIRPVDNGFFQWATQNNRDFSRLNYGIKVTHRNLTGRNDRLHVNFMNGFTRQVALQYSGLNLDPGMKWFTSFNIQYGNNRAVNYKTDYNRQVPVKTSNEDFVHNFFKAYGEIHYRKAIKTRHTFGAGYAVERVADTVLQLNPEYSHGPRELKFADIYYRLNYADVDFIPYPTKGYLVEASVSNRGLGSALNLWQLNAKASGTWPAGKKYFLNLRVAGMLKLPFDQPYITQQFIGHDNMFLQGFESYVIDGVAGGYLKAAVARPLFDRIINLPQTKFKALKKWSMIPVKIYAKAFINTGYVYNQHPGTNNLSNTMLYSGGLGLDIITFNDLVIKLEWSFNLLGQNGLYLHPRNSF